MINPNTQEVFELSDYFHQLGNAIGEYIQLHKAKLTDEERNNLFRNIVYFVISKTGMNWQR